MALTAGILGCEELFKLQERWDLLQERLQERQLRHPVRQMLHNYRCAQVGIAIMDFYDRYLPVKD